MDIGTMIVTNVTMCQPSETRLDFKSKWPISKNNKITDQIKAVQ